MPTHTQCPRHAPLTFTFYLYKTLSTKTASEVSKWHEYMSVVQILKNTILIHYYLLAFVLGT